MCVFVIPRLVFCFWTLTTTTLTALTTLFSTITTAAFSAIPIGDVEAGTCEEDKVEHTADIETANVIPRIVFTSCSSTDTLSFTSSVAPNRPLAAPFACRSRMITPTDTVAANMWRTRIEHGAFVPKSALPLVTRSKSPAPDLLISDDNSDVSELPYLSEDKAESGSASPPASFTGRSSFRSRFDKFLLASTLFDDSDSDDETTANTSIESVSSHMDFVCPSPKMSRSSSRPVLAVQISPTSAEVEPSSPSPVDSGYGSRPDTPFIDKDAESKASNTSFPAEECPSFLSAENVPIGEGVSLAVVISSLEFLHHASPAAKDVATQGPVLPQIVLLDEQGRVIDATFDDHCMGVSSFDVEDVDDAYGGIVPVAEAECLTPVVANTMAIDRALLSVTESRAQAILFPTPVYRNCRPALTFVLDCVEEEEEEEEEEERMVREVDVVDGNVSLEGRDEEVEVAEVAEMDEDDECEACGLFFTVPDANYLRLTTESRKPVGKPRIAFGLLKKLAAMAPARELNTVYHSTVEGRSSQALVAECAFDCERGYWSKEGGLASVEAPRDCPAHGGHGACRVGAIFHHTAKPPTIDAPLSDYTAHAIEVVGAFVLPSLSSYDDLDEDGLVLHSSDVLRASRQKNTVPRTGANYDEFMSGFMDDVDLGTSSSTDSFKPAPLGKLGGALKELRDAAMPEAVDHLKEGLGKTESVFRAALAAAPFKLNIPHFKSGGHKSSASIEKLATNEFYHSMKERSAVSMKGKWSNMLNKFAR